jgi:uncharacterized protein with HEPN domain
MIAFRNILVHAYFGIDWDVVWLAARNRCPILREQVAGILAGESGAPEMRLAGEGRARINPPPFV